MDKTTNKILNASKGKIYEELACRYITKEKKYKIIERNFRNMLGEIDIIAKDKKTIVFIEVKYRANTNFGRPAEGVNKVKQERLKRIATSYIKLYRIFNYSVRFDVVEILGENIFHIENAF